MSLCCQRSKIGRLGRALYGEEEKYEENDRKAARCVGELYGVGLAIGDDYDRFAVLMSIAKSHRKRLIDDKDNERKEVARAQCCVALWNLEQEGETPTEETIKMLQDCCDKGDSFAIYNLALYYAKGEGVPQNYEKAIELLERASSMGNATAMNNLAYCYENGKGVPQTIEKAIELYEHASSLGNADAMNNLAKCYKNG